MRLAERQRIAAEKAQAIMPVSVFEVIDSAITNNQPISFVYVNRFGVQKEYTFVYPSSFFETPTDPDWPGAVYLWAFHRGKKQFLVNRILEGVVAVKVYTLIGSLLDLSGSSAFWDGSAEFTDMKPL